MSAGEISRRLIQCAIQVNALRFGQFELKSARVAPYFFNAGAFDDGAALLELTELYAAGVQSFNLLAQCDCLFGPAYKGIPLVSGVAIALARDGHSLSYAFNRKAEKDHGEGGQLVGAPLTGKRVLIVDDVITAGTALNEAVTIITNAGGTPAAALLALDRMERGTTGDLSAVQEASARYGIPVRALATLDDLLTFARNDPACREHAPAVAAYRARYGVQVPAHLIESAVTWTAPAGLTVPDCGPGG